MEGHVCRHARLDFPLTVSAGEDTANIGNCWPPNRDFNVSTKSDNPTIDRWFNTSAYSRAPNGTFCMGRTQRSHRPGIMNWDFSPLREFHFGDGPHLEFRFEAFNFLNNPNWAEPNTSLSSVAFGRISATRTDMRQLQFGLKFVF